MPGADVDHVTVTGGRVVPTPADLPYAVGGVTVEVDGDAVEVDLEGVAR